MLFKCIGHYQYSPVETSLPTQPEEGATATPLCDSIVSINNSSKKMYRHELPAKCRIRSDYTDEESSYINLTNLDYNPSGNEWEWEKECDMGTMEKDIWRYKNSTIFVATYDDSLHPPLFTVVNVHPPVAETQEFNTLKDIFDFVEKREDAPQAGSV